MVGERTLIHKLARNLSIGSVGMLLLGTLWLDTPAFVAQAAAISPPNLTKTLAAQQQLVADRPYDSKVHNDHGNLLVLAGRLDEAGDAYRQAIELAPGGTLARYNLGILLQQNGRFKEAQAEFQDLLKIEARHARAHYQLGMLFHARKQRAKAIEHYARAFAYDPELTFAKNNPHIIDNNFATEALLVSQRYSDAPSSSVPRLYGEPERIVDLMLAEAEAESEDRAADASGMEQEGEDEEEEAATAVYNRTGAGDGYEDDEEDSEDEDEDGGEDASRRALTSRDLDTASSIGRVKEQPGRPSPRRSSVGRDSRTGRDGRAGRVRQGGGGLHAVQPRGGGNSGASNTDASGGAGQRYRRTSQYSTGRLELKLLPANAPSQRNAATAMG